MKTVKSIIKNLLLPIILGIMLIVSFGIYIILYPADYFHETYQSMIQDKYEILINETEPKIIVIGGSSLAFGLNNEMLSEESGYPVVNMGLHAGFGALFNTEIAKANIGEGDIVLLAYEYSWYTEDAFKHIGVDLVMSGIDSKIEMYKYIPFRCIPQIIGYLPTYCTKKAVEPFVLGEYSREAFDENAQMIYKRVTDVMNYDEGTMEAVDLDNVSFSEYSLNYIKEFQEYCVSRGAQVYFVAPPLYSKAQKSNDKSFVEYAQKVESEIGIPYISNPLDYIYPDEYMYGTIYHCSSKGEIRRTKQLIEDLREYGLIK